MTKKTVRLQELVGKLVHDVNGARVGCIRCVHAEREGDDCVVRDYEIGTAALLSRFGISTLSLIGWTRQREPLCVPWDQLDVSDPRRPRLHCAREELKGWPARKETGRTKP
jgi:sporulation protein YlmC with PRC-barrel domain